jgi:hypothetical protein
MTPEDVQRLDRRTWQLFNGYLDGPYQELRARMGRYLAAALAGPGENEDDRIAQAYARIEQEAPELLKVCTLVRLRARARAVVLESAVWPGRDARETEQGSQ